MESAREALLAETKRLLAALNDENRELKAENTRLLTQCKAAAERLTSVSVEKEGLEKDLKHINFNLMQQLRVKVSAAKEHERLVAQMQVTVTGLEAQLQESRLAQESAVKESHMQREQIAVLERRLQQLTERLFRTEAEAGKYADDLNAAISGHRETAAKLQHDNAQRLKEVEEALRLSRANEAGLQRVVEELRYELGRAKEVLRRSHSSSSEGQRRTLSARSEALYAHEQVLTACNSSCQQLRELQRHLRAVEDLATNASHHVEQALCKGEARLREQMEHFVTTDEALVAFLCQRIMDQEGKLHTVREELSHAHCRLQETERELGNARTEQQSCKAELKSLAAVQQELQTMRAELEAHGRIEEELRAEVGRCRRETECSERRAAECRRLLEDEREHGAATHRSYKREADNVDEQLREFSATVSQALRRFDSTTRHRRRLSSSAGGVTSSNVPSRNSTEYAPDGNMSSPSVVRVESSPGAQGHP
ncbi:hypothetical protein TraAM80_01535 [Trypanosoma rangeli]|uniref:Uncharacterized protein n=1 Tax=Trypanosoma rangeli TaxID=5698 RepID=A0A422NYJ7_TRYRA|nr:uncharacterized protein TraAM80_01535 [Trypanosoma rangeli]RNF10489.1 hypothetical protein TraAM80_01535 [Trypanosoma rangeli]|eukprot:RNF10489.1 hypothetical protein TraAM80_01535 [Trypanosoma rangeli]